MGLLRGVATFAMVAYHAFFFKRNFRFVAGMPLAARRVQHALILHTSVPRCAAFSARNEASRHRFVLSWFRGISECPEACRPHTVSPESSLHEGPWPACRIALRSSRR